MVLVSAAKSGVKLSAVCLESPQTKNPVNESIYEGIALVLGQFKVVPTTGLEPVISPLSGFSAVPVVASCVMFMPLHIRYTVSIRNIIVASTGKGRRKIVCNSVREVRWCAELCGSQNLCNSVRTTGGPFAETFPPSQPIRQAVLHFIPCYFSCGYSRALFMGGQIAPPAPFFLWLPKRASIFKWCYSNGFLLCGYFSSSAFGWLYSSGRTADVQPARRSSGA